MSYRFSIVFFYLPRILRNFYLSVCLSVRRISLTELSTNFDEIFSRGMHDQQQMIRVWCDPDPEIFNGIFTAAGNCRNFASNPTNNDYSA